MERLAGLLHAGVITHDLFEQQKALIFGPAALPLPRQYGGPNDTGYADAATRAIIAQQNPGGRWGTPRDAARLVSWLASDEADWVTGQVIASDGGWSSR